MKKMKYTKNTISERDNEESIQDQDSVQIDCNAGNSFYDRDQGSQIIGRFSLKLSEQEADGVDAFDHFKENSG